MKIRYFCLHSILRRSFFYTLILNAAFTFSLFCEPLPLYYWHEPELINFGDYISVKIVERILDGPIRIHIKGTKERKLLAVGSIMAFARDNDVIWGTGINGKQLHKSHYKFKTLDVRSVRGPLTKKYLKKNFNIDAPEIYGDPALLFPYLFPEFKPKKYPKYDYLIVAHYSDIAFFPKEKYPNVVYATEPWDEVISKILDSKFVISSSLHGIVIAEAYGIPACFLRQSGREPLFKYADYYHGTGRPNFSYANSVEEALKKGGEPPFKCNLKKIYEAFPIELWPGKTLINFGIRDSE